jgi:hypothetical protein
MDHTAKWMKTGGEGIPPSQGTGTGNLLGLSPQAAALAVMILLGLVLAGYFTGFPANLHRAAAPAPYPHELARVSFAVGGDVIPHEAVRAAAEAGGGGVAGWGSLL